MPEAEQPIARAWHDKLTETVGQPDADVYLIGHSLGCITILRYLESLPENQKVGGVVLVAGFGERFAQYQAGNHDTFFDHELDWHRIREHCDHFVAISSDDDPHIDLSQVELFKQELGAEAIITHGKGHFGSADGVYEVPMVRDALFAMASSHN